MTNFYGFDKIAMKKKEQQRRYDFFKTFLFDGAELSIPYGFPCLKKSDAVPNNPISFVECRTKRRLDDKWVHFYAEDSNFECLWNRPHAYIDTLKQFKGVITPDFSLYGDLPRAYQIWNCFRNRALGFWMQSLNSLTIPSVSWADRDSFDWCFEGLPTGGTVSVSGNGCYFNCFSRQRFVEGFKAMRERLKPSLIVAVGYIPKELRSFSDLLLLPGYSQQRMAKNG